MGGVRDEERDCTLDSQISVRGTLKRAFRAHGPNARLIYLCPGADPTGCSDGESTGELSPTKAMVKSSPATCGTTNIVRRSVNVTGFCMNMYR